MIRIIAMPRCRCHVSDELRQSRSNGGVETGQRFIGHQQTGRFHQRRSQHRPLRLPTTQLIGEREVFRALGQLHVTERIENPLPDLPKHRSVCSSRASPACSPMISTGIPPSERVLEEDADLRAHDPTPIVVEQLLQETLLLAPSTQASPLRSAFLGRGRPDPGAIEEDFAPDDLRYRHRAGRCFPSR